MSLLLNGTDGVTYNDGTLQSSAPVGRNRIINGNMTIDQRNAGAAVTGGVLVYTLDRFVSYVDTDGVMTFQQVSDAPTGFKYSLKATATTADASLSATQRAAIFQRIEGYNVTDFMLGSANAVQFTASFWVKSTLTGTFGGSFQNNSSNRAYPFTYTISVANTWEQKTVTITGDTTGTWETTTATGLQIAWGLGVGSTYSGTAGAWAAADYNSATGATSVIGTLNATWQVTGVQLETGSTATDFENLQYGQQLALCQRYCQYNLQASGYSTNTTTVEVPVGVMTEMRAVPTGTVINTATRVGDYGVDDRNITALNSVFKGTINGVSVNLAVTTTTASKPQALQGNTILFSAEL
jgi:hypothetical protein